MAGKKGYKNLNEKEFYDIKRVLEVPGISRQQAADIVKRSYATVMVIQKHDTYEGYREEVRQTVAKSKARRAAELESIVPALPINEVEVHIPASNEQALERIANALERMADAWDKEFGK